MRPFVFINVAMTADGKIDTFERSGAGISSPQDWMRVDRLRAEADAVMIGGRTLLNEDPKLTVRDEALRAERVAKGLEPNPVKVGVISNAEIRPESKFLNFGPAHVVIFTTHQTSKAQVEFLRAHQAQVFVHDGARVDLEQAMRTLKDLGVNRLMVEGGGTFNFELLRLGLVDELMMYIAPLIFGGASAPTLADGAGLARGAAVSLKLINVEQFDDGALLIKYEVEKST